MNIQTAIDGVNRRIEFHRTSAKAIADQGGPTNPVMAAASGPAGSMLGYSQRLAKHGEQYKHNVGWVFTAVHRIATRVSDQPARIGRLLPPDASEHVRAWIKRHGFGTVDAEWRRRFGRRLLSCRERERMPTRLKTVPGEYEIVDQHEILNTLSDPNSIGTASALTYQTVASFELTGKAYWWWSRIDGKLQVWYLPANWVTPKHTKDEMNAFYEVRPTGYIADTIIVPAEEITPFLLPDPSDPHRAISPTQTQAPAISADESIQMAQARQFQNDMFPGLILEAGRLPGIDGKPGERPILTRTQRKDLVESVRAVYERAVNFREPLIIDGLIEGVSRMTYNPQEMDYLRSGQSTKSRIMQAFGVNPFMSGENVTIGYAQASVAEDVFYSNVVNPLLRLMSEAVTKRVVSEGFIFWFDEAVPRNPDLRLKAWTVAWNKGVNPMVTEEEWRREVLLLGPREEEDEPEEPDEDEPAVDVEVVQAIEHKAAEPLEMHTHVHMAEQQPQPSITVNVPEQKTEQNITVEVPEQKTEHNFMVQVPEQPAPVVNIEAPVEVNVPSQPAPVVNIEPQIDVQAPQVNVDAPEITVAMPATKAPDVVIHPQEIIVQPAPVTVETQPPEVTVNVEAPNVEVNPTIDVAPAKVDVRVQAELQVPSRRIRVEKVGPDAYEGTSGEAG